MKFSHISTCTALNTTPEGAWLTALITNPAKNTQAEVCTGFRAIDPAIATPIKQAIRIFKNISLKNFIVCLLF
ncbi:hypothetical protein C900_05364 [Fulvivirga imtechensis AK7]|uniref:Uncharacterized protein n=1 Tax=Fulvivirga imtechensis AK7 TaxID=1237149 RepID=L8JLQ3_9BACT|nr:hypothetical protein C900_05364 [Fulvivirga imtechensis AK7]